MVVTKAVKLSHIVCAVFSLSRPRGATSSQIYKFCTLKYNIRRDRRQFDRALQRAEDEDLITCFQKRYHIGTTSRGSDILWSHKARRYQGRQRKRPRAGAKLPSTRTCKKRVEAGCGRIKKNKRETTFCFLCSLEKRRREGMKIRKRNRGRNRLSCTSAKSLKGVILCKSFTCHDKRQATSKKTVLRRSSRIRKKNEAEIVKLTQIKKRNVRARREHRGKRKRLKNIQQTRKKRKSSKSKKSSKKPSRRDVFRKALQRPTRTVAHAESWDRINYSWRRNELENQELMKDSKMVKRILSTRHGPSWDNLNKELRRIKSVRSCELAAGVERTAKKRRS